MKKIQQFSPETMDRYYISSPRFIVKGNGYTISTTEYYVRMMQLLIACGQLSHEGILIKEDDLYSTEEDWAEFDEMGIISRNLKGLQLLTNIKIATARKRSKRAN